MRKLLLLSLFYFISLFSSAQAPHSMASVDAATYSLWQKKDWSGLIAVGKDALKADIDFYYLRIRMGIAYFEKKNYHMAIHHFEKAIQLNSHEEYLKEYLYYAYLFAGRESDARAFRSTFPQTLKTKLVADDESFINQVNLFYSYILNADNSVIDNYSINVDLLQDGVQDITKNLGVFNLGLKHIVRSKFSISHAYSNIQKTSFAYVQNDGIATIQPDSKISLHQYYLSGNARIARGFNLLFGGHYINLRIPLEVTTFGQGQPQTVTRISSEHYFVGFVSMYKNFNYFKLGTSFYYSGLNSATQLQGDLALSIYPLGNLNLYLVSTTSFQGEIFSQKAWDNRILFDQLIGTKITKSIWAEGFGTFGDMHNFVQNDGSTVYNGSDVIKRSLGTRLIWIIKPQVKLSLAYTNYRQESFFANTQDFRVGKNQIIYSNHSITGGLVWNF